MMSGLPSGTVTFLFTDIEGSTRLWEERKEEMGAALVLHDEVVRAAIDEWNGLVFATGGDGFAAAFARASDGVAAAIDAQRRLHELVWPAGLVLRVRMGLHSGEASERGGDYFGPVVNRAARVMAAAPGGTIAATATTVSLAGAVDGVDWLDLGAYRLRGLAEPVAVFGVVAPGLPVWDRALVAESATRGNLPRLPTEFVGRVAELQRRVGELRSRRLVTLTGPGGIGKTRVALELGWLLVDEYPGGVWMIDLGSVTDPEAIGAAIAATLRMYPQPGVSMKAAILDWLAGRRLLLILDNCEHVLDGAAVMVQAILGACPSVTVLATSREPLGVTGEHVRAVPSLDVTLDAIDLFADRARAVDETFTVSGVNRALIETICRRLDGIPLAIELAAARVRSISVEELLERLQDRFRLLRGSGRGIERHQTLRATVTWSYQLLTPAEQTVFARLAVFAGSFDLRAAEAIASDDGIDLDDVVDLVTALVDRSMVIIEREDGQARYRMLETLRQYAEERLDERGEVAHARDRHLYHYVSAASHADDLWRSATVTNPLLHFDRLLDNLRAAHSWAIITRNLTAAEALVRHVDWYAASRVIAECGDWAARTIALSDDGAGVQPDVFAAARHNHARGSRTLQRYALAGIAAASHLDHPDTAMCWALATTGYMRADDWHNADQAATQALSLLDARTHPATCYAVARELWDWAMAKDADTARRVRDEVVAAAERFGWPGALAGAANVQGSYALFVEDPPDYDGARRHGECGVTLARSCGDVLHELQSLAGSSARPYRRDDDTLEVSERAINAIATARFWGLLPFVIEPVARTFATLGLPAAAVVAGYLERRGTPYPLHAYQAMRTDTLAYASTLPDSAQLQAKGRAMSRDDLVTFVLEHLQKARAIHRT